jgi:hypothetical protein
MAWSRPAWFEMGLLKPGRLEGQVDRNGFSDKPGRPPRAAPAEVQIAKPVKRAEGVRHQRVVGRCLINGRKVGDRVLDRP